MLAMYGPAPAPTMSAARECLSDRRIALDGVVISGHAEPMNDVHVHEHASWSMRLDRGVVLYCARGRAALAIGDRLAVLEPGDVVVAGPADRPARALDRGPALVLAVPLDEAAPGAVLHASAADVARIHALRVIASLLDAELGRGEALDRELVRSLGASLARYVERWRGGPSLDRRVARALALLARDPARRWTLAELAKACGLSRAHLARRFAASVGTSPLRYLAERRMEIAARRLAESDDPLVVIGAEVGYASEFAFAKAFKRRFGVAPGAFRRGSAPGGSAPRAALLRAA